MIFKKTSRWKLFLKGVELVLVLSLALSLCSMVGFTQEKVKLTWSEWWDHEWGADTIKWIISSFEQKHPNVEIESIYAPIANYESKVLTLAQAGEVPDIMGMEFLYAAGLSKLGIFRDLKPLFDADPELRSHYNPAWHLWWKGRMVMTFLHLISYHVAYNPKMFAEKGIEPPTDWEELRTTLRKFHDPKKRKYGIGLFLSTKATSQYNLVHFWARLIQAGGRMVDDKGFARFNSPAGVRTLEYLKSLLDEGLIYPGTVRGALAMGEKEVLELFSAEQIPMNWTGPYIVAQAHERNPELQIAYCPPFRDVTGGYIASGSGIALSSQSQHPELAWEFFKHLLSTEIALKMVKEKSLCWANTVALESPVLKRDPVLRYIPALVTDPDSQPAGILPKFMELFSVTLRYSQKYFLGQVDVRTALRLAEEEWNKIVREAE